ncbi:MAG: SpoIVB peptidase S55 domain protein [Schwartzia sp.]|nr:SpoIVB peptidase S55 domain protein [Schwartzia sp. (in: firmicutes)]
MKKYTGRIKKMVAAVLASASFAFAAPAMAVPDIMPLADVSEGMTGTLYTVVNSTGAIESFDAEVVGVMRGGNGAMPYIIARSEGAFADTDGGLMQGMSGSPVYIDGLLIGAASATLEKMDPHTFLITPIEEMLAIWDLPDYKNQMKPKPIDLKQDKKEEDKNAEEAKEDSGNGDNASDKADNEKDTDKDKDKDKPNEEPEKVADDAAGDKGKGDKAGDAADDNKRDNGGEEKDKSGERDKKDEIKEDKKETKEDGKKTFPSVGKEPEYKATFYASGFGDRGFAELQKKLNPMGYRALPYGGIDYDYNQTEYNAELSPGDAVGAALVYGDFSFVATGTVTAVDEGRILAFGHPFLHRGNVNYFMTDATILGMVNGVSDGLKFANTGKVIGRINQDRSAGIGGEIGVFPMVVPLRMNVKDATLGRDNSYSAMMAYDEDFLPILAPVISYAALGRTSDTAAGSTVKVHFVVRTNATEKGTVERTNLFYSPADTGQFAFNDMNRVLSIITSDTEREADIYDVSIDITSELERKTASLISAIPDKPEVQPGDTVNFTVTLKPYRAEKVKLTVPYVVPKTQRTGTMNLDIHGGGLVSIEQLLAAADAAAGVDASATEDKTKTTESKLLEIEKEPANNDIVIEPGAGPVMTEAEQKKAVRDAVKAQDRAADEAQDHVFLPSFNKKEPPSPRKTFTTDYVIDNVIHATLHIKDKE